MDLYREIKLKKDANGKQQKQNEEELILMTKGKAIDYFVLIIEGEIIVILLLKLFWPTMRKNCYSDWENLLKFKAEGREFANVLRSLEQFIQTVKTFW